MEILPNIWGIVIDVSHVDVHSRGCGERRIPGGRIIRGRHDENVVFDVLVVQRISGQRDDPRRGVQRESVQPPVGYKRVGNLQRTRFQDERL